MPAAEGRICSWMVSVLDNSAIKWNQSDFFREARKFKTLFNAIFIQDELVRHESYWLSPSRNLLDCDQRRKSSTLEHQGILFFKTMEAGQQEVRLRFNQLEPLGPQFEKAFALAKTTAFEPFDFNPQLCPKTLQTFDPALEKADQVLSDLEQQLSAVIAETSADRAVWFNSAECFLGHHKKQIHFLNGVTYSLRQSRLYFETAASAREQLVEDEFLDAVWLTQKKDLNLDEFIEQTFEKALQIVQVVRPVRAQHMPVMLPAVVFSEVLFAALSQLSGANEYYGLPFKKVGEYFIKSPVSLDIISNPLMPFGAGTSGISEYGGLHAPLHLVQKNRSVGSFLDARFSQYLKRDVTHSHAFGNIVVQASDFMAYDDMTHAFDEVLEIVQLSGLFIDPLTMTYSSEIRLAKLHTAGKVTYIKGGSISGNFFEDSLQGLMLSANKSRVHLFDPYGGLQFFGKTYEGPAFVLFSHMQVTA
jgi:hypothetical protein